MQAEGGDAAIVTSVAPTRGGLQIPGTQTAAQKQAKPAPAAAAAAAAAAAPDEAAPLSVADDLYEAMVRLERGTPYACSMSPFWHAP